MEIFNKDGEDVLQFQLLDPHHPEFEDRYYFAKSFGMKEVKSSSGVAEKRYTINTEMILFDEIHVLEFSLTDRQEMKYPVLLGRTFLSKKFIVDVARKDLSFKKIINYYQP